MSDQTTDSDSISRSLLREALKDWERKRLVYDDQIDGLAAAARRFLALTETGREIEWCETHESSANHAQTGEYCDYSIENNYCFTPCSMVRVFVIPADYLTEEE